MTPNTTILQGKKGLVVGIANSDSIAYGCARAMRAAGAELAVTYLNDRAEPYVRPLAEEVGSTIVLPLDVDTPGQVDHVFDTIAERWGRLDFLVHSIAFAPASDLQGRMVDCSLDGFLHAMRVSCYSLIEMTRRAEALMPQGGTVLTMSFYGADKVVGQYNLMGPVKAALQSTVRYLANELGPKGIRVHAISAGPIRTRAGSGLAKFDQLLNDAETLSPLRRVVTIDEVGQAATFLVSDWAHGLTGDTVFVDGGRHIVS
jgi:enoyl-[acyl-carrier protein] reductase I